MHIEIKNRSDCVYHNEENVADCHRLVQPELFFNRISAVFNRPDHLAELSNKETQNCAGNQITTQREVANRCVKPFSSDSVWIGLLDFAL